MKRRRGPYTRRVPCQQTGCSECAWFEYDTLAERADAVKRNQPWRCSRHTNPEYVLSLTNRHREKVLTVGRIDDLKALFFVENRNGFIHGPGFKAYANDFPEGTQIRVTVEVIGCFEGVNERSESSPSLPSEAPKSSTHNCSGVAPQEDSQ